MALKNYRENSQRAIELTFTELSVA